MPLPIRYLREIREIDGVESAVNMNWFGAKHPVREDEFFANMATDPKVFLDVYNEIKLGPGQGENWAQNRKGAIVGADSKVAAKQDYLDVTLSFDGPWVLGKRMQPTINPTKIGKLLIIRPDRPPKNRQKLTLLRIFAA